MTRKWPVLGILLAVLWLFVNGAVLTPIGIFKEILTGLFVGLPIAWVLQNLYTDRVDLPQNVEAVPYALLYILVFLRELLTANVSVAYRVLSPQLPIKPAIIELPLRIHRDAAITTIANSITLTPGTLTLDYHDETNTIYVHTIFVDEPQSLVAPIRQWEEYALVIFDEELKPGDPPPESARIVEEIPSEVIEE